MQSVGNCLRYPFDVPHHVIVPVAQDAIVMIAKPLVTNGVAFARRVLSAVDFNNQALLPADQIDDVRTNGFLTHELHSAKGAGSDTVPQPLFRNGGPSAKMSR